MDRFFKVRLKGMQRPIAFCVSPPIGDSPMLLDGLRESPLTAANIKYCEVESAVDQRLKKPRVARINTRRV